MTLDANVTTGGSQTYNGPVALGGDVAFASTGNGDIDFASTLDGAYNATVSTGGVTTFGGAVGGTTALTSLTTDAAGSTTLGGNVTTTGAQTYNDAVVLGADVAATSTGGGNIGFASTVDGAHALAVNTAGTTTFGGAVGGTTALTSLTTDAAGSTTLDGNVTTTGAQTYNDAVTLGADVTATSTGGGNIGFASTVDGAHVLGISTGGGVAFNGAVGGTTQLAGLNSTSSTFSANALSILGDLSVVTTGGGISQGGAWSVSGTSSFDAGANAITLTNAGNDFAGAVSLTGGTTQIVDNGTLTLGTVNATNLTASGSGGGIVLTQNVTTTGAQTYNDAVTLGGDVTAASGGGGNIDFASTVDGAHALAVNTAGTTTFGGAVGGTTALTSLTTDAAGSTTLGGNVTTTGAQTYNDAVALGADVTATSLGGGNIGFASTVDSAHNLSVSTGGATTFGGAVGGVTPLASLTANSGTFAAGALNIAGNLSVTTSSGGISQSAAWVVGGTSDLNAGANAITLANAGNDFAGAVSLTGGTTQITDRNALTLGTINTGALTVTDAGPLNLGGGIVGGALSATSNGGAITQTGALTIAGTSNLNAGSGANTLTNAGNDFQGAVTAAGAGVSLTDANDLTIAALTDNNNGSVSLIAGGSLALPAGSLNTGTGDLTLAANGGTLSSPGTLAGSNISLSGYNGLLLSNDIIASNTLTLTSGNGAVVQTGGVLAASTLTGSSAGATTLNGANQVGMLGNFSANGFSLTDTGSLTVAAGADVDGGAGGTNLTTISGDLTIAGLLGNYGGATTLTSAGTINEGAAGVVKASTLTGSSVGATALNGANQIASLGNFSANGFSLTNTTALTITGTLASGTVVLDDSNGIVVSGAVNAATTSIAPGTTMQIGDGTGNGSISGNVAGGGTLAFDIGSASSNGYSTLAYGGVISGPGMLRAINTSAAVGNFGILSVSGQNTFTGGAEIGGAANGETGSVTVYASNVDALGAGTVTVNKPGELWISGSSNTDAFANTLDNIGYVNFQNLTLEGQTITNGVVPAFMDFSTGSSAGNADIANAGLLSFDNDASTGTATIQNSGSLDFGGTATAAGATIVNTGDVGIDTTLTGNLAIGSLSGSGTVHLGSGTLILGGLNHDDTISGSISDGLLTPGGSLAKTGTGTLTLDGQNTYTGGTEVQAGTLIVGSVAGNGASVAGNVNVDAGATLGGHGSIGGNVAVSNGGIVAPGDSIGTLTVNGDFTAAQGSVLDYEFGAPAASPNAFTTFGSGDSMHVGGNLELDGVTLNVTDAGGMGPGLYNLFTYGGTLTEANGGFALNNTTGQTLQVQNLIAQKQINLIDTTGLTLDFWNANGQASSTQMGGGSGTWSVTAPVWTDATGSVPNLAMQPQPGFAIFGGTPGTVAVDDSSGNVTVTGMQFAVDGYTLTGGTLTLAGSGGAAPIVRVGDGSAAGAGMTATIDNVITGAGGLVKSDNGTLVLAGVNTFAGGVAIDGGTLSANGDANLGDASNAVTLNGGTLEVTGTAFTHTSRGITLGSAGGGFDIDAAGNTFTLAQALSGTGSLGKTGSGTLMLTGANTYSGGTTISAGTLQVGNGGTAGAITGDVADNGALVFNRSDAVTFAGVVSGSGSLVQAGSGALTLNGDSGAFAGTTTVRSGTLVVGDDSHAGAALGGMVTVAQGATLGGTGTLGGLDLASTLAPGGSIGTLHVSGNATFEQGSVFGVEVGPGGSADQLAVGGAVTIKDGSVFAIAQAGNWAPLTTYTIITAGKGVAGTFGSVSDNLAFLTPVLGYSADAVELTLERNDINFADVALTPNEKGAATGAGGLDFGNPLYDALVKLDNPTAQAAFAQLSGEYHASQQTARVNDSRYIREAMGQRLRQGDADADAAKLGDTSLDAWAHAWGHWATTDSDGNAGKLADNGDGLLIGVDLPVGARGRIGVAGGTSRNSLSVGERASWGKLTSQWLGAFGGIRQGALALRGGVAYAWDQIPTNREVDFPGYSDRLSGNASGNTLTGFVEGAWKFELARGDVEPFLNLAHTRVETDRSTEAGGPAALRVEAGSVNMSFGTVGARGGIAIAHHLDLRAELGWQHAFGDTTPGRTLQLVAGGPAFTEYGAPVAKNAGLGKIGLDWHTGRVTIDADYEGLSGGGVKDQAAKLSVSVAF